MDWFDLMSSDHFHVVLHSNKKHGLIFNRIDGSVATAKHDDAKELSNLKKVGKFYGIVGSYLSKYLVLIKNRAFVGSFYEPISKSEHNIYVITQVQVIDISCLSNGQSSKTTSVRYHAPRDDSKTNDFLNEFKVPDTTTLDHEDFSSLPVTISTSSYASMQSRAQWNPFRLANSLRPKMPTQFLRSTPVDTVHTGNCGLNQDDSDKRLVEEMVKLFDNTNSFYFSPTLDLTNRFSREHLARTPNEGIWKAADERFFWNKHMLKDLIELSEKDVDANCFICVILQGFIAIEHHRSPISHLTDSIIDYGLSSQTGCNIDCDNDKLDLNERAATKKRSLTKNYQLALISRRSVFQAGTRYRRRGCDEEGNCANFVETEQIFRFNHHFTSLVMIRGSIPLFWYQTGYNYRPPPVLYRSEQENNEAFDKHFSGLINSYETEHIIAVDCTEQSGREKSIHEAYKRHMERLKASKPRLTLIEFDFHKHCRGRQCVQVQIEKHLRSCGLDDKILKEVRYYWNDGDVVWNQDGVFRVNCLDCSDRTNVVQRAIALQILDIQMARLGVITPDTNPEDNECRRIMHHLWSTNGNVLSTQYCGTRALFSEDTKLSGYLKDTYSSASRYYISKFRDAYRQAAIDAMLGVESSERGPNQKDQNLASDQYELMSLEPILGTRVGGALLKDVGNRVTNRLARLKGRFNAKPIGLDDMALPSRVSDTIDEANFDLVDGTATEALGLNIDWPSSESVENNDNKTNNVFTQLSHSDDSFQDDEFGQLMLSIDLTELQKLRDDEHTGNGSGPSGTLKDKKQNCEEFVMTESGGLKSSASEINEDFKTSTT